MSMMPEMTVIRWWKPFGDSSVPPRGVRPESAALQRRDAKKRWCRRPMSCTGNALRYRIPPFIRAVRPPDPHNYPVLRRDPPGDPDLCPGPAPPPGGTSIRCHHYLTRKERRRAVCTCHEPLIPGGFFILSKNIRLFSGEGTEWSLVCRGTAL